MENLPPSAWNTPHTWKLFTPKFLRCQEEGFPSLGTYIQMAALTPSQAGCGVEWGLLARD